jgi:hypothetical protein
MWLAKTPAIFNLPPWLENNHQGAFLLGLLNTLCRYLTTLINMLNLKYARGVKSPLVPPLFTPGSNARGFFVHYKLERFLSTARLFRIRFSSALLLALFLRFFRLRILPVFIVFEAIKTPPYFSLKCFLFIAAKRHCVTTIFQMELILSNTANLKNYFYSLTTIDFFMYYLNPCKKVRWYF